MKNEAEKKRRNRLASVSVAVLETYATSSRHTAVNATLLDRLAGNACKRMQITEADRVLVRVSDPAHFAFTSAHVRRRNVDSRTCIRQTAHLNDCVRGVTRYLNYVDLCVFVSDDFYH